MSIYPALEPTQPADNLPLYKDWAYDFARQRIALPDGKFSLLEGLEAIKVWIFKAIHTPLGAYSAYSDTFGSYIDDVIGEPALSESTRADVEAILREALLVSPYVTDVRDVTIAPKETGGYSVHAEVDTVYGTVILEVGL